MVKKFLCFSIIFLISIFLFNISYATDIAMDSNNNVNTSTETIIDNTIYLPDDTTEIPTDETVDYAAPQVSTTTTTEYESEAELSISNMINIILIVVGVVLIFLGIAIIIKLK